jgi:acetyl-CoA acyltransferase
MENAYICDAIRTPIGRYGGALAGVRSDDLAAIPIAALVARNQVVDWNALDDVIYGCANQSGEDNRNVGRMALLLAGLPKEVPGSTVNRLCGSSLEAVATAARAIKSGEVDLVIAGGVESMSRAPFVIPKAEAAFSRSMKVEDTTIGWRFVNPAMKAKYGTDSMPETGEIVAEEFHISRVDQDQFALRSQQRAADAMRSGRLAEEITPVCIPQNKGEPIAVSGDEHPRPDTTLEALTRLKGIVKPEGTVTASARRGQRGRRGSPANHGHGACACDQETAR